VSRRTHSSATGNGSGTPGTTAVTAAAGGAKRPSTVHIPNDYSNTSSRIIKENQKNENENNLKAIGVL
jgi:hypothetical protein